MKDSSWFPYTTGCCPEPMKTREPDSDSNSDNSDNFNNNNNNNN